MRKLADSKKGVEIYQNSSAHLFVDSFKISALFNRKAELT